MPEKKLVSPTRRKLPTYSGPAIPVSYDPNWQIYVNLTKDQIAWFQAQPEWQNFVAWVGIKGPKATAQSAVSVAQVQADLTAAQKPIAVKPNPAF